MRESEEQKKKKNNKSNEIGNRWHSLIHFSHTGIDSWVECLGHSFYMYFNDDCMLYLVFSSPFGQSFWCKQKGHLTMPKRNVFRMNFVKCCYGFVNFPFQIVNLRSKKWNGKMRLLVQITDPAVDRLLSGKYSYRLGIQFAQCFFLLFFWLCKTARVHGILIVKILNDDCLKCTCEIFTIC